MNGETRPTKLGIIGAGGVGSATAYAATLRGSASEIVLYDIDGKRAHAEALDIAHGSMFAHEANIIGGSELETLKDADMIIITAGARQEPNQPRMELAGANVRILEKLLPDLMSVAPGAIYMLVTNPCDVLTVVTQKSPAYPPTEYSPPAPSSTPPAYAGSSPPKQEYPLKRPRQHRRRTRRLRIPVWSAANIGMVPLTEWEHNGQKLFTQDVRDSLAHDAMRAAYNVIAGKGSTNYAIGVSASRIAEAFLQGQNAVLPVSTTMAGKMYGFNNVALSLPSIVSRDGVQRVLEVPMDDNEHAKLRASAEAIRASLDTLGY